MKALLISVALFNALDALSLSSFFTSQPVTPYLHPLSRPETNPAAARAKRQAYQVYVDGESSVSLDKTGQSESGPWGQWTPEECSRTCGGGVQIEKRQCSGDCTGPSVRYVSCNLDPCPEGKDFRAEQCAAHNDDALDGNYHKWLPYKGKNKCELLCKPDGANFYYKWDDKVVDGTKCDAKGEDICVDGVCLPVGCDGKLGSALKVDKCGICDGDGSKCKTIEGTFDERNLSPGYHDVMRLPAGATAIKIEEARPSSNNLALKNSTDHFFLNGNSMIQVEKDVELNGVYFEYDDSKPERITAKGPLKEDVTVAVLFRKGNRDAAIKYEFSIPIVEDVEYMYKPGEWSPCSVTCGKGEMTRTNYCIDTKTQRRVNDALCDNANYTKPESEKSCETVDCEAEWFEGEWEPCSQTCGDQGEQYRVVYCHQIFANGRRITVEDGNCTSERPSVRQVCNRFSCPEWQAGPWSACSEKCGDAFQYRSVTCRSEKEGEEGKLLPAEACDPNQAVESQRSCNLGPCEGLKFYMTEWKLCSKCNDTEETREVTCKDNMGRAYPLEKCLSDDDTEIPPDTRACATQQPCLYEWTASQWSKCSTECGHGHKTRRVICAIHEEGDITVVDEALCSGEKPEDKTNCTNEEKCTGTWYTGPWSPCSVECGGGNQERVAVCLNYDKKPVPEWCDEDTKPELTQECNTDDCPTCFDSEFGCCPDNSTFATGDFNQGCSNCTLSEFGCCADNYTEATGANGQGCPEFVESPLNLEEAKEDEGSGDKPSECQVTNEDGEVATVDCAVANTTATDIEDIFGNGTDTNATMHCSKSEFGCCSDWVTPAEGPNNAGCPEFVLGVCNETTYGCCHDDVTLARGPNLEGCGEPTCAGSLYGCCKDRKTIAFGPHYAGCERSSFPCELSSFGCCSDGETAALGPNGTGCGENCLTTKYGCCPDGKGTAKGHHNEGCGCVYAQYGCCPDGKTSAKGAGFYGCPDSCAQSQFGCCPDGKTPARGSHKEGCPCQYTRYGCCPDGETTALGPRNDGCDDCRYAKYGCCPDGESKAIGPDYAGCPSTTLAPFLLGGTVAPAKISSCALPQDQGAVCSSGYKLVWYYDTTEGRCSQFWYGGCEGNDNRFATKEQCETICVEPPGIGRCYLPKVEGPLRCDIPQARYWYDYNTKQCAAFWWRGCHGNANNFASWEECSTFCKDVGPFEISTTPAPPPSTQPPHFVQPIEINEGEQDFPTHTGMEEEPASVAHEAPAAPVAPAAPAAPASRAEERPRQPMITMEEVCRSTQDSGPCQDYSDQYYYDAYKGTCQTFIYGGCGGNLNRFRTEDECMRRCGFLNPTAAAAHQGPRFDQTQQQQQPQTPHSQQQQLPQQQPQQQPDAVRAPPPGVPQQLIPSQHQSKSRQVCHLPLDVGKCQGSFNSWYYEMATGSCVEFKYSGCSGNANRFASREDCESTCVRQPEADSRDTAEGTTSICDEVKDTGPCTNFVTKWYYNKIDGTCNRFHYGGCEGTGNRFDNEQSCKAACANHQDVCTLPKVQGPCSGKHEYYFFNPISRQCEKFVYGGCLGNTNRFSSIEECQARCQRQEEVQEEQNPQRALRDEPLTDDEPLSQPRIDLCLLPLDSGECSSYVTNYYYDHTNGICREFIYGGCGGNANRFETADDCASRCAHKQHVGRRELSQSFYDEDNYDARSTSRAENREQAELFEQKHVVQEEPLEDDGNYDSLRGIDNDEKKVLAVQRVPLSPYSLPELCNLPEEHGSCYDDILRWRYDPEKKSCTSFMYGGCDMNANHFTSEEDCERACGSWRTTDVCSLPPVSGNCEASVSKWYYDKSTGSCAIMYWTGCGGNGNRFSSREDCESLCREEMSWEKGTDICMLPRSSGPCSDAISMWYFDSSDETCKQFTYSGCRGNENRFTTKERCVRKCVEKLEDEEFNVVIGEDQLINKFEVTLKTNSIGSYEVGDKIELTCDAKGLKPIVWRKNAHLLQFTRRIQEHDQFTRVTISRAIMADSGEYQCAAGADGIQSNSITVKVTVPKRDGATCVKDLGTQKTCALIVQNGLCAKKRYRDFCCRSCLST